VGLLGQLPVLPVGAGLGEAVAAKRAALAGEGAAEDAVIVVDAAGGVDRELQAGVADLAALADGLGLGGLGVLAGLGEEPFGVLVAAGGPVQPPLPAVVLDHRSRCLAAAGVAVGGAQRPKDLADAAFTDADDAGQIGDGEPLAALGLPQPPELLDALGAGEGAAAERGQGAAYVVLAAPDLAGDLGRVERLAAGDLAALVELLDALQRQPAGRASSSCGRPPLA